MVDYLNKIKHVCNTELMQFTLGKTEKAICSIKNEWLTHLEINDDSVPDTLVIPIILTNNSLAETEQWTIRLKDQLPILNIVIISSKDTADYTNSSELINYIKECDRKDIPNVIVMCTNGVRINTCYMLFNAFSHLSPSPRSDINIKFDPIFDEVDKQTKLLKKFLKKLNDKSYMVPNTNNIPLINKIQYISATLDKDFWKMLIKLGVPELENLDSILENNFPRPSHEELINNYKTIENDALIYHESISNPVEYVEEFLNSDGFDINIRNIIFAPAKNTIESHESMMKLFNNLNFTVLLHNGEFKGFVEPNGDRTSLDTFNVIHFTNKKPQMMDTLRKWNELNPNKSLSITGFNTIERGITFNTTGFNFTHIIISDYHAKKLNRLLQLVGRNHGHSDYCNPCILITKRKIFIQCKEYIDRFLKMKESSIEKYNITDFSKSPSTIPVKIIIHDNDLLNEFMDKVKNLPTRGTNRANIINSIHNIFIDNKDTPKLDIVDKNNRNKINLNERTMKTVRKYTGGPNGTRRFKQFNNNHNNCIASSQKGEGDEYTLDIACEEYIDEDFINPINIIWLTYRNEV